MASIVKPADFTKAVDLLRRFFKDRGFLEVHTQNRLSILAACEDPTTIATFDYAGMVWPLPQTGQMWLEYELLQNPDLEGLFCVSTSYRQEPNPIDGRHDLIFPMFEFETHGGIDRLISLERNLCENLGFGSSESFSMKSYADVALEFDTREIEAEHEEKICEEYGNVVFLTHFPQYTSPFWNMRKVGDKANKVDVIIHGIETIGSAERSTDPEEMKHQFHTISDGHYADTLFSRFGKERVTQELEDFLNFDFFPRIGGGIGVTRMIRALKLEGVIA